MTTIRTRIRVGPDHSISGTAPPAVPPGEHEARITFAIPRHPPMRLAIADLPRHRTAWDGSISLRRSDMYSDDGR
jgi:hypothetical protein